jgi:hypothetical protein
MGSKEHEFKGSLTRDFRLFHESVPPRPPSIPKFFQKFTEIFANEYLSLFSGVNDTGKKLIAGVVDTGD